jgi:CBS domain containing-hemolysin-like protein
MRIIFFVLCFLATALFYGTETALTSLSGANIRRAKEKYRDVANYLTFWETRSNEVLTMIVVFVNFAVMGVGVMGASLNFALMRHFNISTANPESFIVPVAVTVMLLLFGSIIPKTFSRYHAERIAVKVLPFMVWLTVKTSVLSSFFMRFSIKLMRMFIKRPAHESSYVNADEVDFLLSSEKTSPLPGFSRDIISKIMDFSDMKVSQVMTPVANISAVDIEEGKKTIINSIIETEFSRVPVYKDSIDNIIGIIYSKDLAFSWRNDALMSIEDLMRPVYYVPENAKVEKVLKQFRTGEHHIAIVVDEFRSTIGLVTMEDLVEEIVGEITDEHDENKPKTITKLPSGAYVVEAGESVTNVNNETRLNIPEKGFVTINGWVLELFGRIPAVKERVRWESYEITVIEADEKSVKKILIRKKG